MCRTQKHHQGTNWVGFSSTVSGSINTADISKRQREDRKHICLNPTETQLPPFLLLFSLLTFKTLDGKREREEEQNVNDNKHANAKRQSRAEPLLWPSLTYVWMCTRGAEIKRERAVQTGNVQHTVRVNSRELHVNVPSFSFSRPLGGSAKGLLLAHW